MTPAFSAACFAPAFSFEKPRQTAPAQFGATLSIFGRKGPLSRDPAKRQSVISSTALPRQEPEIVDHGRGVSIVSPIAPYEQDSRPKFLKGHRGRIKDVKRAIYGDPVPSAPVGKAPRSSTGAYLITHDGEVIPVERGHDLTAAQHGFRHAGDALENGWIRVIGNKFETTDLTDDQIAHMEAFALAHPEDFETVNVGSRSHGEASVPLEQVQKFGLRTHLRKRGTSQFALQFGSPIYTHARAPKGGISIGGRFYPGGKWIPKEAMNGASPEEQEQLAGAGIHPQGGGDQTMDTGSQLQGGGGPDEGGGMPPPAPPPPAPRTRPRKIPLHTVGQHRPTDIDPQLIHQTSAWLRSPSQAAGLDPNDEDTWVRLGAGPDMLPGMILTALAGRGHKSHKFVARGLIDKLGPAFPQIAQQLLPQVPAEQLLGAIAMHPEVQQHLARYARDPRGETLADQRVLYRAVRTAADSPAFATLAGHAMGEAIEAMLAPPEPQPNPDLDVMRV